MPDIFTQSTAYQGTFEAGSIIETTPVFQICAVANINASNQFECTFWINRNGELVDSDLGAAEYKIRDKNGSLVSGLTESGITADANGYFQITPIDASLIYDLNHYVLEIEIPVEGTGHLSAIGLVNGE